MSRASWFGIVTAINGSFKTADRGRAAVAAGFGGEVKRGAVALDGA